MELYSFLFEEDCAYELMYDVASFRLLMELYSFLLACFLSFAPETILRFPSPYGVIFILIKKLRRVRCTIYQFPSPYGVIFILIVSTDNFVAANISNKFPSPYGVIFILISLYSYFSLDGLILSFRLLMELYSFLLSEGITSKSTLIVKVSVSLWSYIHSYISNARDD